MEENEKFIKVRVKKGYTLHIGGEYYLEGEIIKVRPSQVEDQLWKIEHITEVVQDEVKEQAGDEATTDSDGIKNATDKKTSSGRRVFKNKKD